MVYCVLCAVLVLALNVQAWKTEYTKIGKEEGDECHREADEVWTCKKQDECEVLKDILQSNGSLRTCSWIDHTPILCCPPKKQPERLQLSKSEERCAKNRNQLCGFGNLGHSLSSEVQPLQDFEPSDRLIAGGRPTRPREFSSMALIGYGEPGAITWQCGGTLISEDFVLSAAHCVNTSYGLVRWVRVGELDIKSATDEARPQEMEIIERIVHPEYRPPAYYNDLVLFRLSRRVVFDEFVTPACLHTDLGDPPGVGTAAGWGKIETSGPRSSALLQVDISFVPAEDCKQIVGVIHEYLPNGINNATMICAGELGKDTCQGDSGGPLVLPITPWSPTNCLAKLVGVTSFGPRHCGMTTIPGAYVRVAHFVLWIESIVWPD